MRLPTNAPPTLPVHLGRRSAAAPAVGLRPPSDSDLKTSIARFQLAHRAAIARSVFEDFEERRDSVALDGCWSGD